MTNEEVLKLANEHYWDTLEPVRELIIKHIEGMLSTQEKSENSPESLCGNCNGSVSWG